MRLRIINATSSKVRAVTAALLFGAFAFAVGLSATPQLHEWLHDVGDRTNHECAATLLSSGSVELSERAPVSGVPRPAPSLPAFRSERFPHTAPSLEFSRLEHAPPALS